MSIVVCRGRGAFTLVSQQTTSKFSNSRAFESCAKIMKWVDELHENTKVPKKIAIMENFQRKSY